MRLTVVLALTALASLSAASDMLEERELMERMVDLLQERSAAADAADAAFEDTEVVKRSETKLVLKTACVNFIQRIAQFMQSMSNMMKDGNAERHFRSSSCREWNTKDLTARIKQGLSSGFVDKQCGWMPENMSPEQAAAQKLARQEMLVLVRSAVKLIAYSCNEGGEWMKRMRGSPCAKNHQLVTGVMEKCGTADLPKKETTCARQKEIETCVVKEIGETCGANYKHFYDWTFTAVTAAYADYAGRNCGAVTTVSLQSLGVITPLE